MTQDDQKLPMQPVYRDDHGVVRFRANRVVAWLLDHGGIDMNDLAILHRFKGKFTDEEMAQFAQLIGYSVDGFCDLSYTTKEQWDAADALAQEVLRDDT